MPAPDSCLNLNRQKLLDEINRRHLKRDLLAEEIGVTPRTLRRWLHGQTGRVQLVHLERLAKKLGCSVGELAKEGPVAAEPFISPDVPPILRRLRQLVLQGAQPEQFEHATELIQSTGADQRYDVQAAALYEYSRFAFQLGRYRVAQRSLERAILKADAAGVDSIRFQSFLSLAQLAHFQNDGGCEASFLERAEHVLMRMRARHWQPYLRLMEARHAVRRGQLERALALGQEALVLVDRDGHALERIEGLDILASIFQAVGSRRKAQEILLQAESIADQHLSADHPMRGRLLSRQSSISGFLGYRRLASRQARDSIRILKAVLPLENVEMTTAYVQLGAALCDQGDYARGIEALEEGLQGHPEVEPRLRTNLGLLLHRLGRFEESAAQGRKAVELFRAAYGPEHPETAAAIGRHASPLQSLGQLETAENMFAEATRLLRKADPFHVRILDQVRNRAHCLLTMNRPEEAAQVLSEHRCIYTKRDESPTYQGRYSLLQAQALLRQASQPSEALRFAVEARSRFQSPGVDPALRYEAEAVIQSIQRAH